jgi:hypothetical protein
MAVLLIRRPDQNHPGLCLWTSGIRLGLFNSPGVRQRQLRSVHTTDCNESSVEYLGLIDQLSRAQKHELGGTGHG